MRIDASPFSCGFKVITGVSAFGRNYYGATDLTGPVFVKQIEDYISREKGRRAAIGNGGGAKSRHSRIGFIFSDTTNTPHLGGQGLADYIRKNELGELTESSVFTNYNSGNKIRCWIFVPTLHTPKAAKPSVTTKPRVAKARQA
jgi:hypothetical protein